MTSSLGEEEKKTGFEQEKKISRWEDHRAKILEFS